jgi:hypothetical protein
MNTRFHQDDNGNKSSTRMRGTVSLFAFLFVWVTVSLVKTEVVSVPESILIFVLCMCGFPVAQRVWGERQVGGDPKPTK